MKLRVGGGRESTSNIYQKVNQMVRRNLEFSWSWSRYHSWILICRAADTQVFALIYNFLIKQKVNPKINFPPFSSGPIAKLRYFDVDRHLSVRNVTIKHWVGK